ncbi:MAG: isoleucine--tRNA ligase, partial [Deltaproteobacteria bacterium]|nr:isoleucine--tRNA ligase [Deltaproteobacteria bacterium]
MIKILDIKNTLNLPKTSFPMKANLAQKEPEVLKKWADQKLYEKIIQKNKNCPKFIFHDGPPYANANIHLGTAMNKILKDFVVRFKNMSGFQCEFVPGWDCHGLPIELQATSKLKPEEKKDPIAVRKLCRAHAEKYMGIQREQFKRLGVLADWDHPYLTMSFDYEATIVRELATLASKGFLQKGKKVIHWCAQCRTALAEAEIEYEEKSSPSIYVKFSLTKESHQKLSQKISALKNEGVSVLIWTTTPWTLPANLAIALHPEFTYVALKVENNVFILAEGLLESVQKECGFLGSVLAKFKAKDLEHLHCQHPFLAKESVILLGDHVTLEGGTGCVHTAPGHGAEDYYLGLKHGLEIFSPVDYQGRFTQEVPDYVGQFVFDTNVSIIQRLAQTDHLVKESKITHSYPHCWRCKKPVLFRATEQWFVLMEKNSLRKKALEWIHKVEWIPSWGKNRIQGMMEARPDWCLSRQRVWGVPIPALYCKACSTLVTDGNFMLLISDRIEKEGADFWFKSPAQELAPKNISCSTCHSKEFNKEKDILDV